MLHGFLLVMRICRRSSVVICGNLVKFIAQILSKPNRYSFKQHLRENQLVILPQDTLGCPHFELTKIFLSIYKLMIQFEDWNTAVYRIKLGTRCILQATRGLFALAVFKSGYFITLSNNINYVILWQLYPYYKTNNNNK